MIYKKSYRFEVTRVAGYLFAGFQLPEDEMLSDICDKGLATGTW